jgi:eukaryotic-like serine/threonine-protein kinase
VRDTPRALEPRWEVIEPLLDRALGLAPDEQEVLLRRMGSDDPALEAAVRRLLEADHRAGAFLEQPAALYAAPLLAWVAGHDPLEPGATLGGYQIVRRLGRGATATVYLAHDPKHRRSVAVKVLNPDLAAAVGAERFLREIEIAATLQHPHILPLFDSGAVDGLLYYVMPHVEGESLRQRLAAEGPLPVEQALRIAREVAEALDYSHRHGVVHRDVKPENILLQDGQAIVADFGIARAIHAADDGPEARGSGTPAYMSPEQADRTAALDGRSDVYALGCVLYEMLAGAPPFGGATPQVILTQHASAPIPSLRAVRPDVPDSVERAITRALQKSPADRFGTAGELVATLDRAASEPPPERSTGRASPWRPLGLVVAAVLVGVFAWSRWRPAADHALDPHRLAILPFRVEASGDELTWLREGLVDLVAIKLAGEAGVSVVAPRSVLAAWARAGGSGSAGVTSEAALAIARELGAGRVLDGAVVGSSGHLSLAADLLSSSDGRSTARASVEGPADSVSALVDRLAARLLGEDAGVHRSQLASLTTTSLPALREYLAGRAAFRKGSWSEALRRFHGATLADSTFALAALEVLHAAYYSASFGESEEVARAKRLALRGRGRLGPADQALLDVWAAPFATTPERLLRWQEASRRFPDRAEIWYGLGDTYYHEGMFAGLNNPLRLAADAFQRAWAIDSAAGGVSSTGERPPELIHMVEIAQVEGDTAAVLRLAATALVADSTNAEGWYFRWHRTLALGDAARRAFWRDSSRIDPETFPLIYRLTAWTGLAPKDYARAAERMIGRLEVTNPGDAAFTRNVVALNGGRPGEAARAMAGFHEVAGASSGLSIRQALHWGADTGAAVEEVRRLARTVAEPAVGGWAGMDQLHGLCAVATWKLAQRDYRYAEAAIRRLGTAVGGLPVDDSVAVAEYAALCAALLEADRAVGLRLPEARSHLARADTLARTYNVGESLGANLVVARLAEVQGDLPLALRAVRRRAGRYDMLPWYLSTYLREEGRLSALAGDTAGAVRAYRHYLTLRPDPEPAVRPEVEAVRARLAGLRVDAGTER